MTPMETDKEKNNRTDLSKTEEMTVLRITGDESEDQVKGNSDKIP